MHHDLHHELHQDLQHELQGKYIMTSSENEKTQNCNTSVKQEIHAATELMNSVMFETELIEHQTFIKASMSNACQLENEVTHKMKQKTMVSCLKQRKSEFVSYPEVPKTRKNLCFSYQRTPFD